MSDRSDFAHIRREYGASELNEKEMHASPFLQFESWFQEAVQSEQDDVTAMVLSTTDANGHPDARVVLLKDIEDQGFVFYTNYQSMKAQEIEANPYVALTFYWPKRVRQVRVRGMIRRISAAKSDVYFASRPITSRLAAITSHQSAVISSRAEIEGRYNALASIYAENTTIPRPDHWGGYTVSATVIEFWQGRDSRLHDRIRYIKQGDTWQKERLSP